MKELDPLVWFSQREVDVVPRHFVKSHTPHSSESYIWVVTNLKGRYGIANVEVRHGSRLIEWVNYFYFEDPAEAMMYELRWSGS